jgi:tetratricopeptide (TPR) repeat protein
MASALSTAEEAQLGQTIEMFEVITQSQPHDYQSLEILKEAYSKLGRDTEATNTSKRIAQAYVDMGQYSSAIMEYETILQRFPEDPDVQEALRKIESQANALEVPASETSLVSTSETPQTATQNAKSPGLLLPQDYEDGRRAMEKIFVETKLVAPADFEECWRLSSPANKTSLPAEPFVQLLQDRNLVPVERSLKLISDKSRAAFVPLATYDIDIDMARTYPKDICRRWCILPVDRMSKSIFVATANPFNQQAATELAQATNSRLLWYLVPPSELVRMLQKVFR